MESEHPPPGSPHSRIVPPFSFASQSPPGTEGKNASEKEKIAEWARKIAKLPSGERDVGAIARAEARLADPDYPNDEILETVAFNLILEDRL